MEVQGEKLTWVVDDEIWKEGGNSYIYLTKESATHSDFKVLKIFKDQFRREKQKERFFQEIEILRRISGVQGCVRYVDHGVKDKVPFVVTDYYSGGNFYDRYIKSKTTDPEVVILERFTKVLNTVLRLHSLTPRLAVRDIKPQNIFLNDKLDPVVGDFGLSLFSDCEEGERLTTMSMIGSQGYRAPEWAEKYPSSDHTPGDIWSLGRLLWAIYAGRNPPNNFESLGAKEWHLGNFASPAIANYIQGLVNLTHELDPKERCTIENLINETNTVLEIIGKPSKSDLTPKMEERVKSFGLLSLGSKKTEEGKLRQRELAAKDEELVQSREVVRNEMARLISMISVHLDSRCGSITPINQSGSGGEEVRLSIKTRGMVNQVGMIFQPTSEAREGGAGPVMFTVNFGIEQDGHFFYFQIEMENNGSGTSHAIRPKSILNLVNQKYKEYEGIISDWFLQAVERQLT